MSKVFTIEFDFMGSLHHAVVTITMEEMDFYYVKLLDIDLLSFMPRIVIFNKLLECQNMEWRYINRSNESFLVQGVLKSMTAAIQEQLDQNGGYLKDRNN